MEGNLKYREDIGTNVTALGVINLARDLSMVNRKNFTQTTKKGVPLVYHCRLTVQAPVSTDSNMSTVFIGKTVPQNWVYRNAAVKLHAAREKMYRKNGVSRKERGTYDSTIRYGWDVSDSSDGSVSMWQPPFEYDTAMTPVEMAEGTWDTTELVDNAGNVHNVYLWVDDPAGDLLNEESGGAGDVALAQLYLNSRQVVLEDQSDQDDTFPAKFSLIKDLFQSQNAGADEVRDVADDQQDNPPYDRDSLTAACTRLVTPVQARLGSNFGDSIMTFDMDIPFGLAQFYGQIKDGSASSINWWIQVLGTSEMQG